MTGDSAKILFALALALLAAGVGSALWVHRRRMVERGRQAEALTAAELRSQLAGLEAVEHFLYALSLPAGAGRPMRVLVRDQDDQAVGEITFPVGRGVVLRAIECAEGQFECHRMFGMTADKVTLHRAGSDAIRMQFEPGAGRERYLCNGELRYERSLFSPAAPNEWRIESHGETVAALFTLATASGVMVLVPQGEMPLVDQLFVIAMSARSAG